jgi:sigma-54-specific transcriptional regulator
MSAATLIAHPESQAASSTKRAKAAIFVDPQSQALLEQIERVAPSEVAVLITGETGTGKELVARHIHERSKRSGPFVAVNCGALSQSLAEAELFGHQAGSFTGATETRAGWFEAANRGTLFLDEIGDLPLPLQVKLLRVLQEREVVRVGSRKAIPLDMRLVASTNVNLAHAVSAGHFRLDLYYRLNVATFELPALRARRGDVVPLAEHFIRNYAERLQIEPPSLAADAKRALLAYGWPGNIRELENVIHFALLIASDGVIQPENLRLSAVTQPRSAVETSNVLMPFEHIAAQLDRLFMSPPPDLHHRLEELILKQAFEYCDNNQVHTARLLGISRNILRTQLKRFGLIGNEATDPGYRISECVEGAAHLM